METLRDKHRYLNSIAFQLIRWNVEANFHQSDFSIFGLMKLKSDFILAFVGIRDVFQRNFKGLFMIDFEGEIACYEREAGGCWRVERDLLLYLQMRLCPSSIRSRPFSAIRCFYRSWSSEILLTDPDPRRALSSVDREQQNQLTVSLNPSKRADVSLLVMNFNP